VVSTRKNRAAAQGKFFLLSEQTSPFMALSLSLFSFQSVRTEGVQLQWFGHLVVGRLCCVDSFH
jgi:hypothetical protein